jgi:hypothetical protein
MDQNAERFHQHISRPVSYLAVCEYLKKQLIDQQITLEVFDSEMEKLRIRYVKKVRELLMDQLYSEEG